MTENPFIPKPAVIKAIKQQTHDTKTYTLAFVNEEDMKRFSFKPGQFNIVSVFGVGEAPFSITSDCEEREFFEHTIRRVGTLTGFLDGLKVGDIVGVRGPYGRGWPLEDAKGTDILIVAGGIGLAPLRPVIKHIARHRGDYGSLEILYGARTPGDMLFTDEFDEWRKISDTTLRLTVDAVPKGVEWPHRVGVVTTLFDELSTKPQNAIAFVCGPEIMMRFVVRGLLERGFSKNSIYLSLERRMRCGLGMCGRCQIGPKYVCRDGPVFTYEEIVPLPDKIL